MKWEIRGAKVMWQEAWCFPFQYHAHIASFLFFFIFSIFFLSSPRGGDLEHEQLKSFSSVPFWRFSNSVQVCCSPYISITKSSLMQQSGLLLQFFSWGNMNKHVYPDRSPVTAWWKDSTQVYHETTCRRVDDSKAAASMKSPNPSMADNRKTVSLELPDQLAGSSNE